MVPLEATCEAVKKGLRLASVSVSWILSRSLRAVIDWFNSFFCFEHPLIAPAVQLGHLLRMGQ